MNDNKHEDYVYFQKLIEAARGNEAGVNSTNDSDEKRLPCFSLKASDFSFPSDDDDWHSPASFHKELCQRIKGARERVFIASLYVGAGVAPFAEKEREFLDEIEKAAQRVSDVKIIMDANRGLRPISKNHDDVSFSTSSARELYKRVASSQKSPLTDSGLYLFNVIPTTSIFSHVLPSPLNEVAGVFHLKAYIIDDCLILSGANLSEEYFTDRQDRYIVLINGAGGLVDFYANLICCFCKRSNKFSIDDRDRVLLKTPSTTIEAFISTLDSLFQQNVTDAAGLAEKGAVAYIIPTLQLPKSIMKRKQPLFKGGTDIIKSLLKSAMASSKNASVRMATAYLNPTPSFLPLVTSFGSLETSYGETYIVTPSCTSHGFAPKKGKDNGKGRDWIPNAFSLIAKDIVSDIRRGNIFYWHRPSWTFHSKGIWITNVSNRIESEFQDTPQGSAYCIPEQLQATILGSSNYGQRSEQLDVESNAIIVLNSPKGAHISDKEKDFLEVKKALANDWNHLMKHALSKDTAQLSSPILRCILPIIKKLM